MITDFHLPSYLFGVVSAFLYFVIGIVFYTAVYSFISWLNKKTGPKKKPEERSSDEDETDSGGYIAKPEYVVNILEIEEERPVEREGKQFLMKTGRLVCYVVVDEMVAKENGMGGMAPQNAFYVSEYDYETTRQILHGDIDDDPGALAPKKIPPLAPDWYKKPELILPT